MCNLKLIFKISTHYIIELPSGPRLLRMQNISHQIIESKIVLHDIG